MTDADRRYPVGLTASEIHALRSILAKADHAMANGPTDGSMGSAWTISVCAECAAQTEWSDRWDDGPYPIRGEDCGRTPSCGSYRDGAFLRCPGTREITVVEKP